MEVYRPVQARLTSPCCDLLHAIPFALPTKSRNSYFLTLKYASQANGRNWNFLKMLETWIFIVGKIVGFFVFRHVERSFAGKIVEIWVFVWIIGRFPFWNIEKFFQKKKKKNVRNLNFYIQGKRRNLHFVILKSVSPGNSKNLGFDINFRNIEKWE